MPLTPFQIFILKLIAENRSPESHIAGGTALNSESDSLRFSRDIDIFHDSAEQIQQSFALDQESLTRAGCNLRMLLNQPSYIKAIVNKNGEFVTLEWVHDSAFRFFPVVPDDVLGFRLHDVDLATNKCLALANRQEVRDILDLIQLSEKVLSLGATIWAACGKDEGFTPDMLINSMLRNSKINITTLSAEATVKKLDPVVIKHQWLYLVEQAQQVLATFPAKSIGCVFLDASGKVVKEPSMPEIDDYTLHFGSVRGCWPRIAH